MTTQIFQMDAIAEEKYHFEGHNWEEIDEEPALQVYASDLLLVENILVFIGHRYCSKEDYHNIDEEDTVDQVIRHTPEGRHKTKGNMVRHRYANNAQYEHYKDVPIEFKCAFGTYHAFIFSFARLEGVIEYC